MDKKIVYYTVVLFLIMPSFSFADSVYLKNKEELKGLIVDDFVDRIILSTADGEKTIMKSHIENIKYDTVEQTYFQLGREYEKRDLYREAIVYYEKALKANPDYADAKNALMLARITYWKNEQDQIKNEVQRKMSLLNLKETGSSGIVTYPTQDKDRLLKRKFGISLDEVDGWPRVAMVVNIELSDRIKKGDLLVAIWGKQTRFAKVDGIIDELLNSSLTEVNVTIERKLKLSNSKHPSTLKDYGFSLVMELDGLTVKDVGENSISQKEGLKAADLIVSIEGQPTRYMPLGEAIKLVETNKEPTNFIIRRNIFLPRRD